MKLNACACLRPLGIGLLVHFLVLNGTLCAQQGAGNNLVPSPGPAQGDSSGAGQQAGEEGIPYSTLFRQTAVTLPGVIEPMPVPYGVSGEIISGESFDGRISLAGLNGVDRIPMGFGKVAADDNARLKIGPVYVFLDSLTARFIWTRESTHPAFQSSEKWLGWIDMGFSAVANIGDRFSLAVRGDVNYLPFQNQLNLTYSSQVPALVGALAFLFPALHGQLAYTFPVGNWPVTISDDIDLSRGRYSNSLSYTFEDFRWGNDSNGSQGPVSTFGKLNTGSTAADNLDSTEFGILTNSVRLSTQGPVFGDFDLRACLTRNDFWYIPQQASLPSGMERMTLQLSTERETMRFKPYLQYDVMHMDDVSGLAHWVRLGIRGPLTEQIDLLGEAGYYSGYEFGKQDYVTGRVELSHVVGPSTSEFLRFNRGSDMLGESVVTSVGYQLNQILGPSVTARLFAYAGENSSVRGSTLSDREARTGLGVSYNPGSKFVFNWDNYYGRLEGFTGHGHGDFIGTEVDMHYRLSTSTTLSVLYLFNRGDEYFTSYSSALRNIVLITVQRSFR